MQQVQSSELFASDINNFNGINVEKKSCISCKKCCLISFILIIIIFFFLILMNRNKDDNILNFYNISYGTFERNKMDIFFPKKNNEKEERIYGSIVLIHGGAWTSGDKSTFDSFAIDFAKKGLVSTTISYHYVNEEYSLWDELNDIKLAIKKLNSVSQEKGYKINGTSLYGHSAGAHLSVMFGYSIPEQSEIPIRFVVNLAGPIDFHFDTWSELGYDENYISTIAIGLNGIKNYQKYFIDGKIDVSRVPGDVVEEGIRKVSPLFYMNKNSVPTICVYGSKDKTVSSKNKVLFVNRLKEIGIKYDFFEFLNSGHSLDKDPELWKEFNNKVDEYCKLYF